MSEKPILEIVKWDETFACDDQRRLLVPIAFESNGYCKMIEEFGSNAAQMFGAWIALASVAAGCPVPGVLCSSRGVGLTSGRLSMMTHFPSSIFERLIEWCTALEVGWLQVVSWEQLTERLQKPGRQDEANVICPRIRRETLSRAMDAFLRTSRCSTSDFEFLDIATVVMFGQVIGNHFDKRLAARIRDTNIRNPRKYIYSAMQIACRERDTDWPKLQQQIVQRIEQIRIQETH